ncbi:hypothetical protein [Ensifer sesbaniae]|nr:hypothetical protein [Ensifer sesbaniae]
MLALHHFKRQVAMLDADLLKDATTPIHRAGGDTLGRALEVLLAQPTE